MFAIEGSIGLGSSLCRWRVGYQSVWVVAANGAEARKVETAGGSAYHGAVLLTSSGGGQAHLPRDLAFFEPVVSEGRLLFLKPLGAK